MRTREKQRIFKRFMEGLSIHQLTNLYRQDGKLFCETESEIEQAIREAKRKDGGK